jgi:bifunctional enzyme CysN/CysC
VTNGDETRVVIAGHVDHGKSTLVGRLLCDTGQVPADRVRKVERVCRRDGKNFEFAFLLDAFEEEQSQGVTIDYTEIRWHFGGRRFLLIDTPGHREFSKNMATGASRADAAVMLLDAAEGVREQFRRHARILAMLGIANVIVAVNKMDLARYGEKRFLALRAEAADFLAGAGIKPAAVVPVSAAKGENLVAPSRRMRWYRGPTLAGALLAVRPARDPAASPLRFAVQDVYKFDSRRILAGRVEAGRLRRGQKVTFLPSGKETRVKGVERWKARCAPASAGDSVGITLEDPLFLERGEIASAGTPPCVSDRLRANIFWTGAKPFAEGRHYKLRLATQETGCRPVSIENVLDAATLGTARRSRGEISRNNMGEAELKLDRPIVFDEFSKLPETGRFVLVDGCRVCGGGIALSPADGGRNLRLEKSGVTRAEREKRNGHPGFVVWLTGLSGSGKSTVARELERALFRRGMQVYVLDGDNVRHGINSDLGFSQADRVENIRRLGEIARLFSDAGVAVITAFISPYREDRERAREVVGRENFVEVFLDCPLETCERRDPKGLYRKARRGEIPDFTGVSSPYERPRRPDVALRTDKLSPAEAAEKIMDLLSERKKTV